MGRPRVYADDFATRVVDVAGRVLATEGPHALSARRVAGDLGCSTAALYREVGGKADLVRAMYLEGFRRLAERLEAATDEHRDAAPLVRLRAVAHAYQDAALASPHLYALMFERPVPEFVPTEDDLGYPLMALEVLVDTVRAVMTAGLFHAEAGAPVDVAIRLWAMNHGVTSLAIAGMLGPGPAAARSHLDAMFDTAVSGLAAPGVGDQQSAPRRS